MEYYSAIKKNEMVIHATTWWNLGNMLSEKSELQKPMSYVIPFTEFIWTFMECLEYANLLRQEIEYWLSTSRENGEIESDS